MTSSTVALPSTSNPSKITLISIPVVPAQPHTEVITTLASTSNSVKTGSLLALNDNYIVYAVKNGLIRVMDRSSNLRSLLRGHPERITDASFFGTHDAGGGSDVLASIGGNQCRIWRVFGREDELSSEMLLEIKMLGLERVVWHPFNPNQLVLLHNKERKGKGGTHVATFVETTRIMTTKNEGHAVCDALDKEENDEGAGNIDGMLKLVVPGNTCSEDDDCAINDLAWSSQDARHLLTAHKDGGVRLWDLRTTVYINANGEEIQANNTAEVSSCVSSAKCLLTIKASENMSVEHCFFLSAFEDASAMFKSGGATAMEPGSYMTSPFVTCTFDGELTLWSPFTSSGSPPSIVQSFQVSRESALSLSNASVCTLRCDDGDSGIKKVPSSFVVLSDEGGNIHALHLAAQWRDVPTGSNGSSPKTIAAITGFDYAVFFKSLQPIFSQSMITSPDDSSDVRQWNLDLYCVQSKAVQKLTLSPSMCAAPIRGEGDAVLECIEVESLNFPKATATTGSEDVDEIGNENIQFDDYEDLGDDEEEEEFSDGAGEDDTSNSGVDGVGEDVIQKIEVPPPPMPGFLGGSTNADPSAFSNWLGNLAAASKKEEIMPREPSPPARIKTEIVDLADLPLPEAPKIPESIPLKEVVKPELLSPIQILGVPLKKEGKPVEKVKEPKVKDSKDKKTSRSSDKKILKSNQSPVSGKVGKIAILKREDKREDAVLPTPKKIPIPESNLRSSSITREDVEDIVRKSMSSHFHKQEQLITAEIQKSVRYEVQSGVVPALNKTVAQTLEQTVSKSLKSNVTKAMKANTSEVVESISSKFQEPIVDSFHQTMREVMLPAYESGTRQMFEQISTSIEASLELKKTHNDETAKIMDAMVNRMDAMGKTIEVLIKAVAQLQAGGSQGNVTTSQNGGPPQSGQEDEVERLRTKIVELIKVNDYEKAFTAALTVSNSAMALFACKHSDLSAVLEGDTPALTQPIMLCLMQQLGADLSTDEDLSVKLCWLQSIAVTLDPYSENIKRHIKGVVHQLVTNLQSKMKESDPALRRHLQMLLQVIRGIGNA
eukprot:CAMPEP_0194078028 /NCGR_PEP_ID=MMETSP0149-20130528/4510_1 /TAXON_ID=122233 /ORGANISM="Chaetoceros debilis, Strain MM31A-1" /LENGTH=1057 /DNA_ID=CAMNT_0038759189 /DNA_START=177 /DNA_END=3350 /DNA_ORIENTATION=-